MSRVQTGSVNADRDLEERVHIFLKRFCFPAARSIQVEARQGFVALSGTVASFFHRQLCVAMAKKVDGVSAVVDQISVQSAESTRVYRLPPSGLISNRVAAPIPA
jgi:osmotically-inducible protein OsmY